MNKKKIEPWALGIGIFLVVFAVTIVLIAVFFSGQHVSLVQDDYYEKGQAYQQEIDTRKRTKDLEQKPLIVYDDGSKLCVILFQPSFAEAAADSLEPVNNRFSNIGGTVTFFRIADSRHDFTKQLKLDEDGRQVFKLSGLAGGPWIVKMHWKIGELDYYIEKRITIR